MFEVSSVARQNFGQRNSKSYKDKIEKGSENSGTKTVFNCNKKLVLKSFEAFYVHSNG